MYEIKTLFTLAIITVSVLSYLGYLIYDLAKEIDKER